MIEAVTPLMFNKQKMTDSMSSSSSAGNKSSIIEGILIDAREDGVCVLTSVDVEKGVRLSVETQVEEPGYYIINAQKFIQTMRVMEGEFITLTVDENLQACISSGKSTHKMNALKGEDFPATPRLVTEDGFVIGQAVLKKMLSKIMHAMAYNDARPVLNGCYFRVTENRLLAVSCDTYKLARCSSEVAIENKNEDNSALNFSFIVPSKTVGELFRFLSDDEEKTVRVYMTRKNIVFQIGEITFFSRLIDGQYIDYDRIIMNNHRIFMTVDRSNFVAALERASLVTEEKVAGNMRAQVKLTLEENLLKISAISTLGSTYDELEVGHEGENLVISFNNRFLIDSLSATDAESVKISMTSSLTGINIEPENAEDGVSELFMLLPVRMRE
ncbi:MAG: DNA polymerase III subunit beta [Clostridia bacterium]|nr:DNA polymerase III subunit beta [Clostridia bacterium]